MPWRCRHERIAAHRRSLCVALNVVGVAVFRAVVNVGLKVDVLVDVDAEIVERVLSVRE